MRTIRWKHRACSLALTAVAAVVALSWNAATAEKAARPTPVTSGELGGKDRYLANVSTDKPIYRPGETVYVRSVILHAAEHTPLGSNPPATIQIKGPKGNIVATGQAQTRDSVSGFAWRIPSEQAGGEHELTVTYPSEGIAPATRKFDIRAYRAPRLKTQITFLRDGYGPGDTVQASLEATRAEGGIPADAKVTVIARLDGREIHHATTIIDGNGTCSARFALPGDIATGDGTLAFVVEDGGVLETATKTIPILLQTVDLTVCPEGGELVAGLPYRVYLEARTPFGKPADIAGNVLDETGAEVGTFRTEHEGRGRFMFVPSKGQTYRLAIVEPAGINKTFELPPVAATGAAIQSVSDVYDAGAAVVLRVLSTSKGPLTVTLRKREEEVASTTVRAGANDGDRAIADVSLTPPSSADGVLIATVWAADGRPLAERLIYRRPAHRVHVAVTPDRERYVPGGPATLTVTATDERGRPAEAVVGLTVTDASVQEMLETRDQPPRLPVMVFLEPEVRELADAQVYLDEANPKAPLAVDLLLGTQGWRRFALVRYTDFLAEHGDAARRAFALRIVTRREERTNFLRFKGLARAMRAAAMDVDDEAPMAAAMPVPAAPAAGALEPAQRLDEIGADADRDAAVPAEPAADRKRRELAQALDANASAKAERELAIADDVFDPMPTYVTVREYAHRVRPNRQPNDRVDFAETLYWCAAVRTNGKTGEAKVAFDMSDAVTSYRVFADAFTADGAIAGETAELECVQPFYVEPKLPLEVTMGDSILLPIGVVNGTAEALGTTTLRVSPVKGLAIGAVEPFELGADARVRRIIELTPGGVNTGATVRITAAAGPYTDAVTRPLRVVPRGFPVELAHGALLSEAEPLSFKVTIPKTRVAGSLASAVAVFPTPLANLTEALARLMREPCGCFEQTSSTTYPLVMAQQYFMTHQGVDPKLIERSRELLDKGYKRLTGFECTKKGYEWFGEDPGHETLTAYGLLEFTDMARVHEVSPTMLERTREWLLGTRDGTGGFKRERRALHTWIGDADCSNAYILWALLATGESPESLAKEIDTVEKTARESKNSYVVALAANVAWLAGHNDRAEALTASLAAKQNKDGHVEGATTSIVGSGGDALLIETTSLAVLAWLKDPARAGNVERGIQWLAEVCKAGRYGSTQSTVLALRAILAYDAARAKPKAPGSVQLYVDGRQAGSAVAFDENTTGAITLTDIAELLEPGEHTIVLKMTGGSEMPCTATVTYNDERPATSEACKVGLNVSLAETHVTEGGIVEADVTVVNKAEDEIIPTPIAIVGIPGGLEVRHDQLKELVKAGRIASYEVIGRDVVLYWRELQAEQRVTLPISLIAAVPGTFTGPASRAYQYYTDEFKTWADPLAVTIAPKN